MTNRALTQPKRDRLLLAFCFVIPCLITAVSYIVLGLYPFGDSQLLAHDEWHQYYPFFVSFREKLLSGGSLEYAWDVGMGTGYASLYAYYLASPLYLLSVLVPESLLREYFAFLTVLKLSCAGLFFGVFLRTTFRKVDFTLPFFALMYALCAWAGGYAWNLMWLDVFALLPLLLAGTVSLLREGRFRLYVASLALCLWCNYYIAYICCIFVLLCFIGYCILCWRGARNFFLRFLRIGLCTLLGAGLSAALLIPTLLAMQTTNSAAGKEFNLLAMNTVVSGAYGNVGEGGIWELLKTETLPGLWQGFRTIFLNLLPGTQVSKLEGTEPNIFCSFTAVLLALHGLFNRKIERKEKVFHILLLLFLCLSFIFRALDYVWHGFHFPNMLYHRFSFVFSFVLISAAYRSYLQWEHGSNWSLFAVMPLGALLVVNYYFTAEINSKVSMMVLPLSFLVLCGMLFVFLLHKKDGAWKKVAAFTLCLIVTCEMVTGWGFAVDKVGRTTRSIYPRQSEYVEALLDFVEENETELFWRTEVTSTQTLNDSALNGYYGVSVFTSSANVNFNRFSHSLGLASWPGSNRYSYYEAMPFTNTLCGIKHLIDREGKHYNTDYNRQVASSGDVKLLENESYISLGFMMDSAMADFVADNSASPLNEQNRMFSEATGTVGDLYIPISHSELDCDEGCTLTVNGHTFNYSTKGVTEKAEFRIRYTIEEDGLYCATSSKIYGASDVTVYLNGEKAFTRSVKASALFTLGSLKAGDEVELTCEIDADRKYNFTLQVARMDQALYDEGLAKLSDEPFVLTEFSDTHLEGTVEVLQDGLFYTSIPYEPGWSAYVDDKEITLAETYDTSAQDVKLTDAVIAFPLSAGSHTIVLEYHAPGLKLGLLISGACLAIFVALSLLLRKKPVLLPDQYSRRAYAHLPEVEETEPEAQEQTQEDDIPAEDDAQEEFDLDALLQEFSSQPETAQSDEQTPEEE